MSRAPRDWRRWIVVASFAIAMAWVEAATVYYLRVMVDRVVPYQPNPLPIRADLGQIELWREAATIVMLLAVGMLAARGRRQRLGYFMVAFGVWDIFYYVFLRLMSGWPHSIFDWDILFLLPLPWWGPVLAPVCIALLMLLWGTYITQHPDWPGTTPRVVWASSAAGAALALFVFMADALLSLDQGLEATRQVLPAWFNWPIFAVALTLMAAAPLAQFRSAPPHPSAPLSTPQHPSAPCISS